MNRQLGGETSYILFPARKKLRRQKYFADWLKKSKNIYIGNSQHHFKTKAGIY